MKTILDYGRYNNDDPEHVERVDQVAQMVDYQIAVTGGTNAYWNDPQYNSAVYTLRRTLECTDDAMSHEHLMMAQRDRVIRTMIVKLIPNAGDAEKRMAGLARQIKELEQRSARPDMRGPEWEH
jgi:hypothetical protein